MTGPAIRCSSVYLNHENGNPVGLSEPLRTLNQTRKAASLISGCMFGTYYSCELLSSEKLYSKILTARDGYPTFEKVASVNQIVKDQDGHTFVRVRKGDIISVRHEEQPSWIQ